MVKRDDDDALRFAGAGGLRIEEPAANRRGDLRNIAGLRGGAGGGRLRARCRAWPRCFEAKRTSALASAVARAAQSRISAERAWAPALAAARSVASPLAEAAEALPARVRPAPAEAAAFREAASRRRAAWVRGALRDRRSRLRRRRLGDGRRGLRRREEAAARLAAAPRRRAAWVPGAEEAAAGHRWLGLALASAAAPRRLAAWLRGGGGCSVGGCASAICGVGSAGGASATGGAASCAGGAASGVARLLRLDVDDHFPRLPDRLRRQIDERKAAAWTRPPWRPRRQGGAKVAGAGGGSKTRPSSVAAVMASASDPAQRAS